jgi:hypothetical protein
LIPLELAAQPGRAADGICMTGDIYFTHAANNKRRANIYSAARRERNNNWDTKMGLVQSVESFKGIWMSVVEH